MALSTVTDEFIAHIKAADDAWDLEQTTSFLLVASTLLDLKAARLLPQGDVEDEEDLALLEARDLLFARLLQYKAFKQVAGILERRMAGEARRHPRSVGLEERFATLLPDVLIGLGLRGVRRPGGQGARAEAGAASSSLAHIHAPAVSVREQATVVVGRLRGSGTLTFRALAADAPDMMTRVARFLALLELFREGVVAFDQMTPLGELSIRWTGTEETEIEITDEFDGAPPSRTRRRAETPDARRSQHDDRDPRGRSRRDRGGDPRGPAGRAAAGPGGGADGRRPAARRQHAGHARSATRWPRCVEALTALAEEYDESGRGFELRNVAGGWRYYTREALRAGGGEVRARRPAGPADPGGAGDAGRRRLQAAGQPQPGLGDPRRQRRRRDAHAAHPRPGRGGRHRPRDRRAPLPHLELLPGAHRGHLARRAARAGAVPARRGRLRGRAEVGRGRPRLDPHDAASDTMEE